MEEFNKCMFCKYYDLEHQCCYRFCSPHQGRPLYEPVPERFINKAKEKEISVCDVIALVNMS